jgi:hypothetical protein
MLGILSLYIIVVGVCSDYVYKQNMAAISRSGKYA